MTGAGGVPMPVVRRHARGCPRSEADRGRWAATSRPTRHRKAVVVSHARMAGFQEGLFDRQTHDRVTLKDGNAHGGTLDGIAGMPFSEARHSYPIGAFLNYISIELRQSRGCRRAGQRRSRT